MKKYKAVLVTLLGVTLIGAVCALAACKSSKLTIEEGNKPQVVFVEGNPLDLAGGVLTVTSGGKTTEIPLEDKDVVVSGYDRYTVGNQTLTISYGGATTTLEITVVPRIAAKNHTEKYFVGENFDATRGELTIYNDDGTYFGVLMNDEKVSVQFDSTVAGSEVAVNASYTDGAISYSGYFNVAVYGIESYEFTAPSQKTYQSHEEAFKPAGGYFTFKGDNGNFSKNVALTADMVSGFDTSIVKAATSPYKQTLTAEYAGKSERFTVTITYSAVSEVKDMAARLLSLPSITEAEQKKAYDAVKTMMALSSAERALISKEDQLTVARVGAQYGLNAWNKAMEAYGEAFVPAGNNSVSYLRTEVSAIQSAYEALPDDEKIVELSKTLIFLSNTYAKETVIEKTTFESYLGRVLTTDGISNVAMEMEYMLGLYDLLKTEKIPANWTAETLKTTYKAQVDAVLSYIESNGYNTSMDRVLYACVTNWRNDAFDMLYTYAYGIKDADDGYALNLLNPVYLPQALEELYENIALASSAMNNTYMTMYLIMLYMQYGIAPTTVLDMTSFMYYYFNAMEVAENIIAEKDPMNVYLFENLEFDEFSSSGTVGFNQLLAYISSGDYGYYANAGAMRDDEEFARLWKDYLAIFDNYLENSENFFKNEQNVNDIDALFDKFLNLTPTKQYYFLTSMNYPYQFYGTYINSSALNIASNQMPFFTYLLAGNYSTKMVTVTEGEDGESSATGADAYKLFGILLYAIEDYAVGDTDYFLSDMKSIEANLGRISEEEKAIFDSAAGTIYAKYKAIYDKYDYVGTRNPVTLSAAWSEKFVEMAETLDVVFTMSTYISSKNTFTLGFMLAAFEHADAIAADILTNGDANVKEAYSNEVHAFVKSVTSKGAVTTSKVTLEYALAYYREMYFYYLETLKLYDAYVEADLTDFNASAYTLMSDWFNDAEITAADVKGIIAKFNALTDDQKFMFMYIDGGNGIYSLALNECFKNNMTESAADAAGDFMVAVLVYSYYTQLPEQMNFAGAWEAFATKFDELSETDKTSFNAILGDAYNFLKAKYDALNASA